MAYIIYHNPRCSKSRAGLKYLEDQNLEVHIVKYLDEGLSKEGLLNLLKLLNLNVDDIIRKHEDYYKKEVKGKDYSDDELLDIIVKNPKLLVRPIVIKNDKAVWAIPPEAIAKL